MQTDNSSESFYNKGIKEYEKGQYDLSIEYFKKAIEIDDSIFDYHFNLGASYIKIKKYDLAIESFNKGIAINPKDIELYINLGLAFYNKGEFEKAAKAYKKTIWLNSADPENFNNAGIAYCALKNFKEAVNNFKHAVRIEPKDQNYCYNLGFACYWAGNYDLAEEHLVSVINYDKQREDGYLLLGKVYIKQGNYDLAKDIFKKLLSINPDNEEAPILIEQINSRKPGESIKIDDDGDNNTESTNKKELSESEKQIKIENHLNLAIMLFEDKKYKDAILEFKEVLTLKEDQPEAIKNIDRAKEKLKEANSLFNKGLSHFNRNEFSKAINYLEKALFIYPHASKIEELMKQAIIKNKKISRTYLESGQYDLAIDALKSSLDQNPNDSEAHFTLGNTYIKQGDYVLALDSLKNTLSLDPDNKEAKDVVFNVINELNSSHKEIENYLKLSRACIENQEYYSAVNHLKKSLEIDPNNSEAKTLLVKVTESLSKS